jgi:hypothetical protein
METMITVVYRNRMLALLMALSMSVLAPMVARAASVRCGWLDNPTPGNASLYDKDGEWTIAVQGGHQATGDWPPAFKPGQWVNSGQGSYGYGCVCLTVEVDAEEKNILNILSGKARPLSACRKDRAIANIEKQLRP